MVEALDENKQRGNWSNKWDYLLSLAGYAVGIGNVYRFPYLCYRNGGGAFLIPYLLMLCVLGLPLFLLESAVGQFSSCGSVSLYNVCPIFKGLGYASMLVNVIASTYYSVIVSYPILYIFYSMKPSLPWSSCDNYWNTEGCHDTFPEVFNTTLAEDTPFVLPPEDQKVSPADEFFHNYILEISGGIEEPGKFVYPLVCASFFTWIFVFLCIFKGVKVVGKVVWFTATFPFVMLFILFFRGVTLPGAYDGIVYYLYPDFNKLLELRVWVDAAVQIFFSLGPGWGTLVTMGSFNRFHNNCLRDSLLVPIVNCATSIFAGFVVFSVLGFLSHKLGTAVSSVTTAGPSLAFITFPEALTLMPLAPLWAVTFFLMLFFLGVDSIFVQMEAMVVSLVDEYPRLRVRKTLVAFISCLICFLGSLSCCTQGGMYMLQLLDFYAVPLTIILTTLGEIIVFAYIYGGGRVVQDLQVMTGRVVNEMWYFAWIGFTPFVLLFILVNIVLSSSTQLTYKEYVYPSWATMLGWLTAIASLIAIPIYFVYYLATAKGSFAKRLEYAFKPTPVWGPALESHRQDWTEYTLRHPLPDRFLHPNFKGAIPRLSTPRP